MDTKTADLQLELKFPKWSCAVFLHNKHKLSGNMAGMHTVQSAGMLLQSTLLTSEVSACAALFLFFFSPFCSLTGPHTPCPLLLCKFWVCSLSENVRVQQAWILRTLLAYFGNAAAINPQSHGNHFPICQTKYTNVVDWWNIHPCCTVHCTWVQAR